MNTNKVRDRTPEELLVKKNEFLKICDILDQLNIEYFLQTGILLGAIREQNFVKWDWGVDISVFSDELVNKIGFLEEKLIKAGFKILSVNKKKDDLKIFFRGKYPPEVTGYTVFGWSYSKIKDVYWRTDYSVPSKFLDNFSKVELFGRKFNCPNPPEEYLTFAYGDWKKPLRSSDKNLYNAGIYYKKRNSFFKVINKIKNKIYSIFNN
tara:strand:- start:78 stop:701 length:624 start_codon:yes stop_codon:yes gene_type:complete